MKKKKTVCFDLDGTLASYKGWQGVENIGKPLVKGKKLLLELSKEHRIIIFTCRTNTDLNQGYTREALIKYVADWLNENEMPFDEIYVGPGKPQAHVYIDDRGYFFNGRNNLQRAEFDIGRIINS